MDVVDDTPITAQLVYCKKCKQFKPTSAFPVGGNGKIASRPMCQKCVIRSEPAVDHFIGGRKPLPSHPDDRVYELPKRK